MAWKTKKVQKTKPVSTRNPQTGAWTTTYETYDADESYWVSDSSGGSEGYSGDGGGTGGGD
jgi:hypothetical protein